MRYYKPSRFTKSIGLTGFITITACCLIAVGAVAWFAVARYNSISESTPDNNSNNQSYESDDSSYNSSAQTPTPTPSEVITDVGENVSDVPYEAEEENEPQPEPEPERSFILPVEGNVAKGYSDTALQYSATYGDMRLHKGIDILCDSGSSIKAAGSGSVTAVTEDMHFGRIITVDHGEGIVIKYCGMESVSVKEGDTVTAGTVIGTSGEIPSECSDNPHIHIEAAVDGETVSPLSALGLN